MSKEKIKDEGYCRFCNKIYTGGGMSRHLKSCKAKKEHDQKQIEKSKEKKQDTIYHIKFSGGGPFWIHVEIKASEALKELDYFLRDIWCECCGHLSQITINGVRYEDNADYMQDWGMEAESMDVKLKDALKVKSKFEYIYDFGSSTLVKGKVLGKRKGILEEPIKILARNELPDFICSECGKPATIIDAEEWDFYCEDCADEMLEEYQRTPIANSPRTGVCGYCGEDEDVDPWEPPKSKK
jgi:hypothetical protein